MDKEVMRQSSYVSLIFWQIVSMFVAWLVIWAGLTIYEAVVPPTVQIFATRDELNNKSKIGDIIEKCQSFDLFSFSGNVMKMNEGSLRKAVANGAKVRIVIYDPGPKNKTHYDSIAKGIGEDPDIKREEAEGLLDLVKRVDGLARRPGSVQLKYFTGQPLTYNMWLADTDRPSQCAHLTTYYRTKFLYSPSVRVCSASHDFIDNAATEFETLWKDASDSYEP